ncbi:MAG TPA: hypothetical protein VFA07_01135 [Chthonomonadaceae bacterium]|nr:hypothetical protein [Chthonomonadaceae bacterium]
MFRPVNGYLWYIYILGALIASVLAFALMQLVPPRARRYVILALTFIGGLYYALEFFLPVHPMPAPDDPTRVGNFLTQFLLPIGNITPVIGGFAVGLGVVNLSQVHGKRLLRNGLSAFESLAFFLSMIAMCAVNILQQAHPNAINKNLNALLYNGGLQQLDATMFSIIAFYIVSAAYRAFRIRSLEATLLLVTAVLVMLGQIGVGQWITHLAPRTGFFSFLRVEVLRDWILKVPNAAAVRAIAFGLGIGALAIALRIWLGLERGSYFDSQG